MAKPITHLEFFNRWFSKPRKVNLVEGQVYQRTKDKLAFTCSNPKHGVQWKSAETLLRDIGCQKCSALLNTNRLSEDKVRDGLKACGFTLQDFSEYKNNLSWINVNCDKGHATFRSRYQDLVTKHTICPTCKDEALLVYVNLSLDAIQAKLGLTTQDRGDCRSLDKKLEFRCTEGHIFKSTPSRLLSSRMKHGCKECYYDSRRFDKEFLISRTKELRPTLEIVSFGEDAVIKTTSKAKFRCLEHDRIFTAIYHNVWYNHTNCPDCNNHGFDTSKPATLYYGRLGDFYKIGITNNEPTKRLKSCHDNYVLVDSILFDAGFDAYTLEQSILTEFKENLLNYNPGVSSGWTEMFSKDIFTGDGLTRFKK